MREPTDILANCGYPTDVLVLDFETYFDKKYSLKKLSTVEYIMDDQFEVLGAAYALCDSPWETFNRDWLINDRDWQRFLKGECGENFERYTVVAQNAVFDMAILAFRYNIHPPFVIDTLGLSRHRRPGPKHDLATLCKEFGLPDKGDTMEFLGVHQADVLADRDLYRRLASYAIDDVCNTWKVFKQLLPLLSRPEVELKVMQQTLELFTKPPLGVDRAEAEKIIKEMDAPIDQACRDLETGRGAISGNHSFQGLLAEELGRYGETVPVKYGKRRDKAGNQVPIMAIAKDDPGLALMLSHDSPRVRKLVRARSLIKSLPLHIKRVRRIVNQSLPLDGLPVPLIYCGARTGRWTSGQRIGLQTLPKHVSPGKFIRRILIPPASRRLILVDASQIEARFCAWVAGQQDVLDQFANDCPYKRFAMLVDTSLEYETMTKQDRQMGKVGVLGCQFGMGWEKCQAFAEKVCGVILTAAQARHLVRTYRDKNSDIINYWRTIQRGFVYTTKYKFPTKLDHGITVNRHGPDTRVQLPSGRSLFYPDAEVRGPLMREDIYVPMVKAPEKTQSIWGGFLTENIVQAMDRDHIAEVALDLDGMLGMRVALNVHDELILTVPKENAEMALDTAIRVMKTPRPWAEGCPLDAEGLIAERYGYEDV